MKIIADRSYFGPHERRLHVVAVKKGEVTVRHPLSLRMETIPLTDVQEFAKGSTRRTYHHEKGEVRTKIRADDKEVFYITPDGKSKTVSRKQWDRWRKSAL